MEGQGWKDGRVGAGAGRQGQERGTRRAAVAGSHLRVPVTQRPRQHQEESGSLRLRGR